MAASKQGLSVDQAYALIHAKKYHDAHLREFAPKWYDWQMSAFYSTASQTMTLAGNRSGKTMSAAYHFACDVTGDYPDWWDGPKFPWGLNALCLGVDNGQLKAVLQTQLFGEIDEETKKFKGGWIHTSEIEAVEWSPHTTGLAKRVTVRHARGKSYVVLRAYTQSKTGQGTLSFAGTSIDLILVDEQPPDQLIGQLVTRTMTGNRGKGGVIRYTMTPELGMTKLVTTFTENRQDNQKLIGPIAWSQCPHLTPEVQASILSGIPEHEREMRSKGVPFFGSGLVYPIPEERITCDPFQLSEMPWIKVLRAMDLGIAHPTAIVWLGWDPEFDVIYVMRDYSEKGREAAVHASVANSFLPYAPMVIPPDIDQTEKGSGKTVRKFYNDAGLKHTIDFENPDGSRYVEPGIMDLFERMRTDRFKVFRGCEHVLREMRMYHRKEGKLVKENDDALDAVRYGSMMIKTRGVKLGRSRTGHKPKVKRSLA